MILNILTIYYFYGKMTYSTRVRVMGFNATFNNISVISWR